MDLSYLELEGQGQGIIMEVTRPLLLGLFYLGKWPVNPHILAPSVHIIHSIDFVVTSLQKLGLCNLTKNTFKNDKEGDCCYVLAKFLQFLTDNQRKLLQEFSQFSSSFLVKFSSLIKKIENVNNTDQI